MLVGWLLLAFVATQRIGELVYARRNTARLRAQGAYEIGARHYPLIALLHALWLGALALWLGLVESHTVHWPLVGLYGALQLFRVWVLWALGARWTTRIIVLPGAPLVARGPYGLMRHPNYALVCAEIAVLPLALGAWPLALGFSFANAALLMHRIRVEDAALGRAPVTPRRNAP